MLKIDYLSSIIWIINMSTGIPKLFLNKFIEDIVKINMTEKGQYVELVENNKKSISKYGYDIIVCEADNCMKILLYTEKDGWLEGNQCYICCRVYCYDHDIYLSERPQCGCNLCPHCGKDKRHDCEE